MANIGKRKLGMNNLKQTCWKSVVDVDDCNNNYLKWPKLRQGWY